MCICIYLFETRPNITPQAVVLGPKAKLNPAEKGLSWPCARTASKSSFFHITMLSWLDLIRPPWRNNECSERYRRFWIKWVLKYGSYMLASLTLRLDFPFFFIYEHSNRPFFLSTQNETDNLLKIAGYEVIRTHISIFNVKHRRLIRRTPKQPLNLCWHTASDGIE